MHNNLMRIRGILSARQGTQIPKFSLSGVISLNRDTPHPLWNWSAYRKTNAGMLSNIYTDSANQTNITTQDNPIQVEIVNQPENIQQDQTTDTKNMPSTSNVGQTSNQPINITVQGAHPAEGKPTAVVENASNVVNTVTTETEIQSAQEEKQEDQTKVHESGLTQKQTNRVNNITNPARKARVTNRLKQRNANREQNLNDAEQIMRESINGIGNTFQAYNSINNSNETNTIDTGVDVGSKLITTIGDKVGGKTGAIMGAIGQVIGMADSTGQIIRGITGGTDQMTAADKFFDSGIGTVLGGFVNQIWSEKSNAFATDVEALETVGSSYGGTAADITEAAQKADKKYGLFSSGARKRANEAAKQVAAKQGLMSNIADTARDQRLAVQSMGEQAGLAYSMMTDGGYNQKYTYAAKHGGLLEWNPVIELEWEPQVELNWELPTFKDGGNVEFVEELEWIPEFKSGGKTEESDVPETEETNQKNVIPEGALHKNKHHMEHAEGLTKKGIPVVDEDGEQQAEIEHSEIIFTLEVTKKLEEYYEIFYSEESTNKEKEQAALDAGKLLVYQILENTEDRTGLIESCKKGGSLTLKKSTDDLIEEVLEWMPTIVVVETEELEEKKEDKSEAKKEQSEKDKMKEAIREVLIELLVK